MLNYHLGTVGFGYKQWNNAFYPDKLSPQKYLSHYAQFFSAVEIDSTFYGPPAPNTVAKWYASTPKRFNFSLKTPRQITHDKRLRDVDKEMGVFLDVATRLADKLGVILIQLPPEFTFHYFGTLEKFLRTLPEGVKFAIEFRHRSWDTSATRLLLEQHNICWVSADYIHMQPIVQRTSNFLFLRFIGKHGQFETKHEELIDQTPRLKHWQKEIEKVEDEITSVYGFFNNDYSGHSPATCTRFKKLLGLPAPDTRPPQQGRLF